MRKAYRSAITVLAVAAAPLVFPAAANAGEATEKYEIANDLAAHGSYKMSLLFYDKAIKKNRYFWPAYMKRGDALARLGKPGWALDDYRQALKLNPACKEAKRKINRLTSRRRKKAEQHTLAAKSEAGSTGGARAESGGQGSADLEGMSIAHPRSSAPTSAR